jgi:hypothetical protein
LHAHEHGGLLVLTGLILVSSWKSNCWTTVGLVERIVNVLALRWMSIQIEQITRIWSIQW